ncbi:hypothetical protein Tco_0039497 [Tanacetum coccineum]
MKKYDYDHLEEIEVGRDDQQLYTFKEGDLKRLHLQDIEDMLLLLFKRKRLMRTDELYKFSDGTLDDVRTALQDIAAGIRMEYLPMRIWSNLDKKRAQDIRERSQASGKDNMTSSYSVSTHFSSYNKGWMWFVKHFDADPVCHSKLLDSVKNWNDHFVWVDSMAFPLFVSLKSKILKMDLFTFIRHSDPTKVRIGEREPEKREVNLQTLTKGRTVLLNPPASAASGGSSDSIDKLFAEGGDARQEHSIERDDDVLEETVAKDISEVGVEKTKKKRKRKATRDASSSTLPPKKLREDYHAVTSNICGKSLATIRGLIPEASVTPIPDSGNGSRAEVNSFTRSPVADVPVMTVAVTTTIAADVSVVPVSRG